MNDNNFASRVKNAWNAFLNKDPTTTVIQPSFSYYGGSYRPDRMRLSRGNERTIITAIYNRIAVDVSSIDIIHAKLDDDGRFSEEIDDSLNECLRLQANKDQTPRAFMQDVVMSMFDEGSVAIVPVESMGDPITSSNYDIYSLRVGKVVRWDPDYVQIQLYNDRVGKQQEVTLPKYMVAIVENPFYAIMNEPNSILQRLLRKLLLLDMIDEQNSSGKLDLIIQLPYTIKTPSKRDQAERRRKDIEEQLVGSKYGIAYTDGTERITQLNRPVENNLMAQIEYLTSMLYSQLGITQGILDGTADEKTMLNYNNRVVEPILSAIVDEMKRKFLSRVAREQKQSIEFFRDPFRLVPVSDISEIADKFTRNEIMTSNEIRAVIGMKPSKDPGADELRNKNLSQSSADLKQKAGSFIKSKEEDKVQNE